MADAAFAGLLVLFFLLFVVVLPLWTYLDAAENSSNSAFLWALVVFLAPLLGILLYVLLGRDESGGAGRRRGRSRRDSGSAVVTHRCQSCGYTYNSPGTEIHTCQGCGGIKVESVN